MARLKDLADGSKDLFLVHFEKIYIENGFNPRKNFDPDTWEIPDLAASIAEKGLLRPLVVRVDNDRIYLVDGERRYRALEHIRIEGLTVKDGIDLTRVPCIPEDRNASPVDRLLTALASNTGKPLDPMEEADAFQRLRDGGLVPEKIAASVGKSRGYVVQRLGLLNASEEVREALAKGEISPTAAQSLARKPATEQRATVQRHRAEKKEIGAKPGKIKVKAVIKSSRPSDKQLAELIEKKYKAKAKKESPPGLYYGVIAGLMIAMGKKKAL
jgi:ParB/RepB/Spo0J family partition protein